MSTGSMLTLAALGDVEVVVTVSLGHARCRVNEVLAFGDGTIVPLGTSANAPVDLLVNGVAIASGNIVELENGVLAIEIRTVNGLTSQPEAT
jgi:flagellar motor switch protein FliN